MVSYYLANICLGDSFPYGEGLERKEDLSFIIIGFSCVLFTYFGVNYLAGLHSYAK